MSACNGQNYSNALQFSQTASRLAQGPPPLQLLRTSSYKARQYYIGYNSHHYSILLNTLFQRIFPVSRLLKVMTRSGLSLISLRVSIWLTVNLRIHAVSPLMKCVALKTISVNFFIAGYKLSHPETAFTSLFPTLFFFC